MKLNLKNAVLVLCALTLFVSCKQKPASISTYKERKDPKIGDLKEWDKLNEDLHVSFGSINDSYKKHTVPFQSPKNEITLHAWKGEIVSAQLVAWSKVNIEALETELTDLKSKDSKIEATNMQTRFVRYVITDLFSGGCGYRKPVDFDSSLVADALDPIARMDLIGKSVRPIWLTVKVPQDAKAGEYKTKITVKSYSKGEKELTVNLKVYNKTLPTADKWKFNLDLWQNPFAISRFFGLKNWSAEHMAKAKKSLELLASAGQKCITTSINHHPWNGQTYDPFLSMIKWTKKKDGTWTYDYTIFDKWVKLAKSAGITQQINCYSMVPWHNRFQYFEEGKEEPIEVELKAQTKEYAAFWRPFLKDFAKHLKAKGWFEHTTIAMDERLEEDMKSVIKLVKSVEKDFKITLAANHWLPSIIDDVYDISLVEKFEYPEKLINDRKAKGLRTTFYTCCSCPYPNTFTFSPSAEATWFAWYAASKNIDGYLRWAYNSWVKDPFADSRFRAWPAGDTYIVYPDAMSSIRFERLREGVQDFEKLSILRKNLTPEQEKAVKEVLSQFVIKDIPTVTAAKMVDEGKEMLNELSK
jgi:hypothetical protein